MRAVLGSVFTSKMGQSTTVPRLTVLRSMHDWYKSRGGNSDSHNAPRLHAITDSPATSTLLRILWITDSPATSVERMWGSCKAQMRQQRTTGSLRLTYRSTCGEDSMIA